MVWAVLAVALANFSEAAAWDAEQVLARALGDAPAFEGVSLVVPIPAPGSAQNPPRSEDAHSRTLRAQVAIESALRLDTNKRKRVRLAEIQGELHDLLDRPSFGGLFIDNVKKVAPWMGVGLIPLAGGLALGYANVKLTVPLTTEQAVIYPGIGIGAFVLTGLMVALGATISHFVDESDSRGFRQQQVDALRLERESLGG